MSPPCLPPAPLSWRTPDPALLSCCSATSTAVPQRARLRSLKSFRSSAALLRFLLPNSLASFLASLRCVCSSHLLHPLKAHKVSGPPLDDLGTGTRRPATFQLLPIRRDSRLSLSVLPRTSHLATHAMVQAPIKLALVTGGPPKRMSLGAVLHMLYLFLPRLCESL